LNGAIFSGLQIFIRLIWLGVIVVIFEIFSPKTRQIGSTPMC
jgi:hypothetical protein